MNSWLIAGIVGVILLLPCSARAADPVRDGPKTATWYADLEKARAAAHESGRPMFLVFRCVP